MLIDSSAWIEFLKHRGNQAVKDRVSEELKKHTAAFSEPIEFEVLSGCSKPGQRELAYDAFQMSRHLGLERCDWIAAVDTGLKLRKKGLQIATIDLLLSAIALRLGLAILTRDADFETIRDNALPDLRIERMK